eukprot:TRINITY_DN29017_c0_g1_i1.p1 TRINITY_DN29017_c0_g1~~TRINITY_DN29017_c0_g1_i1.p1  ORF type:complete len:232 (+),score=59.06 TRINITY_DN29017_c0_g1_i1:49-696(+)
MGKIDYSKWDGMGDEEDEVEQEEKTHRSNLYRSLHKETQELFDYASAGALDEVKMVLAKGAFIDSKLPQNGNTALHLSLWLQHSNVAKYLIENGADLEVKDNDGLRPLHTASYAAFEGDLPSVQLLLSKGAQVEPRSNNGNTPLHLAATASGPIVQTFLEAGANPLIKNDEGLTPKEHSLKKGPGTMKRKAWDTLIQTLETAEGKWLEKAERQKQ